MGSRHSARAEFPTQPAWPPFLTRLPKVWISMLTIQR